MFDSEYFIQCIQKHPSIWEIGSEIYMDKDVKERSWNTVGEMMFPTWAEKTNAEKEEKALAPAYLPFWSIGVLGWGFSVIREDSSLVLVQLFSDISIHFKLDDWSNLHTLQVKMMKVKWRHIRDCYGKFLNKRKSGDSLKKKKYVYADELDFLTPIVLKRISRTQSFAKGEVEVDNTSSLEEATSSIVPEKTTPIKKTAQDSPVSTKAHKPQKFNNFQSQLSSKSDAEKAQEKDADRAFLLSLLPDYRKLNDDQKLDFRFHALQFFRDLRRGHRTHPQNSNYGPYPHPYFLMPFPPEYMRNHDFSTFLPQYSPPSMQQHFPPNPTYQQDSQCSQDQKSPHVYTSDDSVNSSCIS